MKIKENVLTLLGCTLFMTSILFLYWIQTDEGIYDILDSELSLVDGSSLFLIDSGKKKPDISDRVSPINFKLLCDFHYGSLPQPNVTNRKTRILTKEMIPRLWDGVVIFVDSTDIRYFLWIVFPRIAVPFVLVTGDSDITVPNNLFFFERNYLLNSKYLIHWFAMNCGWNPDPTKFTCLMNGISQWNTQREFMDQFFNDGVGLTNTNVDGKAGLVVNKAIPKNDTYWVLASFAVESNVQERKPLYTKLCSNPLPKKRLAYCYFNRNSKLSDIYHLISNSKFVASPHGLGLDCYRTYETLFLGSYPIVKASSLDELYQDSPVLIVKSWADITDELLERTYTEFRGKSFSYEKLYMGYWFQKFRSY